MFPPPLESSPSTNGPAFDVVDSPLDISRNARPVASLKGRAKAGLQAISRRSKLIRKVG